ncbi:MAG: LytTR family DNA-binding domain-containing protein [Gammaproteobacteria bacterium]
MAEERINNGSLAEHPLPRAAPSGRQLRLLAFYLGVPLIIGLYGALNNWELLERAGYLSTLGFYAAHAFIPWWMTCTSTSLAMWSLRAVKPNPYVLMAIGAVAGGLIALPYTNWLTAISSDAWQDPTVSRQIAPIFSAEFWRYILRATVVWFGINVVFDRFLGLPRYRYVIPRGYDFRERAGNGDAHTGIDETNVSGEPQIAVPGFVQRIPARITVAEILGIKAEQHYIRVFTPQREYMVLYRFSDAVRELDPQLGLQVHRSFWVSKEAIDTVRPSAKKFSIKLTTGATIPVSTPYHGIVKEYSRAHQIPIR